MSSFPYQRIVPLLAVALAACSTSSGPADAGDAGPVYDGFIAFSCGATEDCVSAGLDADTCTYASTAGCGTTGQCQVITIPADISSCSAAQEICPCSGGTPAKGSAPPAALMIPPCWPKGRSPYPFSHVGACSLDGGS